MHAALAAINDEGPCGCTPLVMVCTTGDAEATANLVAAGAKVNVESKQFDDHPNVGADGYPINPEDDGGKRRRTPLLVGESTPPSPPFRIECEQ